MASMQLPKEYIAITQDFPTNPRYLNLDFDEFAGRTIREEYFNFALTE